MQTVSVQKRFAIALSFPGGVRNRVGPVAALLAQDLGEARILYDKFHEAEFARANLDTHLQHLYHDEAELIVVILCAAYEHKQWCGLEWRAIRDLIKQRKDESIMFLSLDDAAVSGVFSIDGYVDVSHRTDQDVAGLILQRLSQHGRAPLPDLDSKADMVVEQERLRYQELLTQMRKQADEQVAAVPVPALPNEIYNRRIAEIHLNVVADLIRKRADVRRESIRQAPELGMRPRLGELGQELTQLITDTFSELDRRFQAGSANVGATVNASVQGGEEWANDRVRLNGLVNSQIRQIELESAARRGKQPTSSEPSECIKVDCPKFLISTIERRLDVTVSIAEDSATRSLQFDEAALLVTFDSNPDGVRIISQQAGGYKFHFDKPGVYQLRFMLGARKPEMLRTRLSVALKDTYDRELGAAFCNLHTYVFSITKDINWLFFAFHRIKERPVIGSVLLLVAVVGAWTIWNPWNTWKTVGERLGIRPTEYLTTANNYEFTDSFMLDARKPWQFSLEHAEVPSDGGWNGLPNKSYLKVGPGGFAMPKLDLKQPPLILHREGVVRDFKFDFKLVFLKGDTAAWLLRASRSAGGPKASDRWTGEYFELHRSIQANNTTYSLAHQPCAGPLETCRIAQVANGDPVCGSIAKFSIEGEFKGSSIQDMKVTPLPNGVFECAQIGHPLKVPPFDAQTASFGNVAFVGTKNSEFLVESVSIWKDRPKAETQ